jgi:hypothetical protein
MKMIRTFAIGVMFTFSVSCYAVAQENVATVDKPAENRLEVETADLAQPAGKGITTKKEHKGTVSRKLGKLTKEQSEAVRNLDKEYAKLIEILQIRIDLLKKERLLKTQELVTKLKEQTTTAPATTTTTNTTEEATPATTKTEKEKTVTPRRRIL